MTAVSINGQRFIIKIKRQVTLPTAAPRLVVVAYQPNKQASEVLRVCLQAIQRYTPDKHELWVVDNNSPAENIAWLLNSPGINIIRNLSPPIPPHAQRLHKRIYRFLGRRDQQREWGSYANAIALEIATRIIDPQTQFMMTLHMDTMPCHEGWLSYLQSKMVENIAASGVRADTSRVSDGVLHVLGYVFDFQLFKQLNLDFLPHLPHYDVGDRVTVAFREAGYDVFDCPNTIWQPDLIDKIPMSSPLRNLQVDRAFDDNGNVIFLHLGRSIRKSTEGHHTGITAKQWVTFAEKHLLMGSH